MLIIAYVPGVEKEQNFVPVKKLKKIKEMRIFNRKESFLYYPPMPFYIDLRQRLPRRNIDKLKVLNVGVGVGNSGLAVQLPYFNFERLDLIDVHKPYLDSAVTRTWAAKKVNFILADIVNFDTSIYDLVLMFDVLEHLPKLASLKVMEKIKCKQVIFGPLEKEFRENKFGAESQDHLSLWTEKDFKSRGYKTEVLKNFHKEDGKEWDALWALKN